MILAPTARDAPPLPISSGLPQLPDSPKKHLNYDELKPASSMDSASSMHNEGHLVAGRQGKGGQDNSSNEVFEEVPLQASQATFPNAGGTCE